jgi:ATP-binding cassette, subfamily B, bacterial
VSIDVEAWRGHAEDLDAERTAAEAGSAVRLRAGSRALLGSLLRPHRRALVWVAVLLLLQSAAEMSGPYLVKIGIDKGLPPLRQQPRDFSVLFGIAVAFAVVTVAAYFGKRGFITLSGRIGQAVLFDLRGRVYHHFQRLSVGFHERYTSGRMISRLTSDMDSIAELLDGGIEDLVVSALSVISVAVILLWMDLPMALVALLSFPFLLWLSVWFQRNSARAYRRTREAVALVIVHFVETMSGIRAVQTFRREPRNEEIFHAVNAEYRDANLRAFRLVALFSPGIKLIGNVSIAMVLTFGGYQVLHGHTQIGVLAAFLLYLRKFFEPMQDLSQFYNSLQSASAALEKLSGVLDEPPAVAEPARPAALPARRTPASGGSAGLAAHRAPASAGSAGVAAHRAPASGGSAGVAAARDSRPAVRGEVDFADVTFAYRADRPVLPTFDLHIPAGQTLALVGATGAGKTTIAKLIARFYDPTAGTVRLDGVDLRALSDDQLRSAVVMVTQENYLFSGTVADNIRFGKPSATDEEVVEAARAIGADRFIQALPEGYRTDVRKRGGRLSAGQRQLVAFARAFLADPAVLILDEATSSLDIPSERLVQRALRTILADRTAVVIAHRLSTVEIADRVLVLDGGRVVEDGPPQRLIRRGGRYADLHRQWEDSLV